MTSKEKDQEITILRDENKYMLMKPASIKPTSFGTLRKEQQSLLLQFTEMP